MLHVGLTGGIASGKSTVARMFVEQGAALIDCDALAYEVEAPGGAAWQDIVTHFGKDILRPDGTIDRKRLGAIVFADPQQRALLNRLVHPAVLAAWQERLAALREEHPEGIVVSDIPLLVEVGMGALLDLVILVYVAPEEQIRRLTARNGLTREEAVQRLASQMPLDEKIRHAQAVIDNNGDREATRAQVETLWGTLRERERALRLGM